MAFSLGFAVFLPFIDVGNLTRFLLASSYLTVGRNPYTIFAYPPPPGLFALTLPTFGVYVLSGHDLFITNFSLKLWGIAGLLATGELLRRIALLSGIEPTVAKRLGVVLLTSPVLFFISFIWVEQDIIGIALTLGAIYVVLREERGNDRPWVEFAGFALLAFAAFFYYFPIFVFPTLLFYSGSRNRLLRRTVWAAGALSAFGLWFLYLPGWNFLTNSTGTYGFGSASLYSIFTLLEPALFLPTSSAQLELARAFVVVLVALEVAVPILAHWRGVSWIASVTLAIILPFLFLDILNGDEFVWPLPFLLLAIVLLIPSSSKGIRLWLVQSYAIPMVIVANLFDSPGPGGGTGIFYFSYPQFHNALSLWTLVPQYVLLTKIADVLLWGSLAALALFVLWAGRANRLPFIQIPGGNSAAPPPRRRRVIGRSAGGTEHSGRPARTSIAGRWSIVLASVAVCAVFTLVTASVATPSLTSSAQQEFPVAYFASYPVANASVTYALNDGARELVIAPNYGDPASWSTPWRTVNFSRNVSSESLHLTLNLGVFAKSGFPYNTTVMSFGGSGLNILTPFVPPAPPTRLTPFESQNVSTVSVTSPQFSAPSPSGLSFNGSSYAAYNVDAWVASGGNLTVFFRWTGVQLQQNVVAMLFIRNASYELFGENGLYIAGEKPTATSNWTFASPRLVNAESWHSLTMRVASDSLTLSLDGIPFPMPVLSFAPGFGGVLTLGDAGPYVNLFREFDFVGTMVGPYYTTGSSGQLSPPSLCGFPTERVSNPTCTSFDSPQIQADYTGGSSLIVTVPSGSFSLSSTIPLFQLGRLSPVGPEISLRVTGLSISTTNSLLHLTWVIDGAIAAPVIIGLWVSRYPRGNLAS